MNIKEYFNELYGDLRKGVIFSEQNMVDFAEGYAKYCLDKQTDKAISIMETCENIEKEFYFGVCEVEGCNNEGASGGHAWRDTGYWTVCLNHSQDHREGKLQPRMKQDAIDRENTRGKDGFLPLNKKLK